MRCRLAVYAPRLTETARARNMTVQPRVLGYRKHPILHAEWEYVDVATKPPGSVLIAPGSGNVPD